MIASENYIYTNSKRECNIEYYQYYRSSTGKNDYFKRRNEREKVRECKNDNCQSHR